LVALIVLLETLDDELVQLYGTHACREQARVLFDEHRADTVDQWGLSKAERLRNGEQIATRGHRSGPRMHRGVFTSKSSLSTVNPAVSPVDVHNVAIVLDAWLKQWRDWGGVLAATKSAHGDACESIGDVNSAIGVPDSRSRRGHVGAEIKVLLSFPYTRERGVKGHNERFSALQGFVLKAML